MREYCRLLVRHKGAAVFVPVILGFVVLSLSNYGYRINYAGNMEQLRSLVAANFQMVAAVLAGWWPLLFYSSFIDRPGNEVFYLYVSGNLYPLWLEAVYLAAVALYFLAVRGAYELPLTFLGSLAGEIFFMSGLVFFLIQLTRSTGAALGTAAIYCVYLIKFDLSKTFQFLSVFPESAVWDESSAKKLVGALGIGAGFHAVGWALAKKRRVYF